MNVVQYSAAPQTLATSVCDVGWRRRDLAISFPNLMSRVLYAVCCVLCWPACLSCLSVCLSVSHLVITLASKIAELCEVDSGSNLMEWSLPSALPRLPHTPQSHSC